MITPFEQILEPTEIVLGDKKFVLGKIPAFYAQGLCGQVMNNSISNLPAETVRGLLKYVYVELNGQYLSLDSDVIINQHCSDLFHLYTLETKQIEKNFGFLFDGKLQKLFEELLPAEIREKRNTTM